MDQDFLHYVERLPSFGTRFILYTLSLCSAGSLGLGLGARAKVRAKASPLLEAWLKLIPISCFGCHTDRDNIGQNTHKRGWGCPYKDASPQHNSEYEYACG